MYFKKIIFIFCITIAFPFICYGNSYSEAEITSVLKQIKSSAVYGVILDDTYLYESIESQAPTATKLYEGDAVEILEDKTALWYCVKTVGTDEKGWIRSEFLKIPSDPPTNKSAVSSKDLEIYVNAFGFGSRTKNLVWVDIDRQRVYIFEGEKYNWQHKKTITCSTGKNQTPTLRGVFEISQRGVWFYSERLKSGAKFWVRYSDSYLFHSLPMDINKNLIDKTLGTRSSSGCVRMSLPDSKWFYSYMEEGTRVFIN